jgi:hypothetical protein
LSNLVERLRAPFTGGPKPCVLSNDGTSGGDLVV